MNVLYINFQTLNKMIEIYAPLVLSDNVRGRRMEKFSFVEKFSIYVCV
jgi:hypothetical protein